MFSGEVTEWPNVPDSKSGVPQGTGGSNPSLSATHFPPLQRRWKMECHAVARRAKAGIQWPTLWQAMKNPTLIVPPGRSPALTERSGDGAAIRQTITWRRFALTPWGGWLKLIVKRCRVRAAFRFTPPVDAVRDYHIIHFEKLCGMKMRVLVTGAAGRLGRVSIRTLTEAGHEVLATDRHPPEDNLADAFEPIDLLDSEAVRRFIESANLDAIVHLGNHSWADPALSETQIFIENMAMNMNVFQAAHDSSIPKLVFASTIQVISSEAQREHQPLLPVCVPYVPLDAHVPASPSHSYALSKYLSEQMLAYFANLGLGEAVSLRLPFLPVREPDRRQRESINPWKIGQGFAWLSRSDAARLIEAILRADLPGSRIYLPAAAEPNSIEPVEELLAHYYANVPRRDPQRSVRRLIDISRITEETGWRPIDGEQKQ